MSMKSGALEPADNRKLISLMAALQFSPSGREQKGKGDFGSRRGKHLGGRAAIKSVPEPHLKQTFL